MKMDAHDAYRLEMALKYGISKDSCLKSRVDSQKIKEDESFFHFCNLCNDFIFPVVMFLEKYPLSMIDEYFAFIEDCSFLYFTKCPCSVFHWSILNQACEILLDKYKKGEI